VIERTLFLGAAGFGCEVTQVKVTKVVTSSAEEHTIRYPIKLLDITEVV